MLAILPLAAMLLSGPAPASAARRAEAAQTLVSLFTDADYPAAAMAAREQGAVAFRLEVGADGRPDGCSVESSSGSQSLDSTTCRLLMERARFTPARDSKGRPTRDRVLGRIIWRLDGDVSPRLQAAQMLWTSCLMGEAAKRVLDDRPVEEIVRAALVPCASLEGLVAAEVGAPAPLEEPRATMVRAIAETLSQMRTRLKEPADPPTP